MISKFKGEEVKNPKRNLPLSIALTLIIGTLCYCSVSVVLTLMIPYYKIDAEIPLPQAYDEVGLGWAKLVVTVGAIASLITW
jgi:amino acid transporter